MKLRKGILILLILVIALAFGLRSNVKAETTSQYLGVEEYRNSGYKYIAYNKTIWKIASYPVSEVNTSGSTPNYNTTFYCIKAGPGFGSRDMTTGAFAGEKLVKKYDYHGDLRDKSSISSPYVDVLPTGDNYKALIWVLEHCYIPEMDNSGTYKATLLSNAGITNSLLTDDDIDAIQQLAIWYYTNEAPYNQGTFELAYKKAADPEYTNLDPNEGGMNARKRGQQVEQLFDYLIGGWAAAGRPNPTVNSKVNPISSINSSNATIQLEGNDYILGPYTLNIDSSVNVDYTLTASLKNGTSNVQYTILNNNKQNSDINSVKNGQFYIKVSKNSYASGLTFSVQATTTSTEIKYWS